MLLDKGSVKRHAPTPPFHSPQHALNYSALVTFISPKSPVLLVFKGITHVSVPLLKAPAVYFQWKHPLTTNTVYLVVLLDVPLLQNTMHFTFRAPLYSSAYLS